MGNKAKETHPNPQGRLKKGTMLHAAPKERSVSHMAPGTEDSMSFTCPQYGIPIAPFVCPSLLTLRHLGSHSLPHSTQGLAAEQPSSPPFPPHPSHLFPLRNTFPCHLASLVFSVEQKLYSAKRHFFLLLFHSAVINTWFDSICSILQLVSCNCLALETVLSEQVRQIINKCGIAPCILSKFETFLIRCLAQESLVQSDNCNLHSLSSPFVLFPLWLSCNLAREHQQTKPLENNSPEEI